MFRTPTPEYRSLTFYMCVKYTCIRPVFGFLFVFLCPSLPIKEKKDGVRQVGEVKIKIEIIFGNL